MDGCKEVSRQLIVAGGNAPEVFEPAKSILDAVPLLIGFLIEAERLFAIGLVGDDRRCAAIFQALTQFSAIVGLITEKFLRSFTCTDQALRNGAIVRLAPRQKDGKKTAFSICNCVDFRIAPAARTSNRLVLFPLFPPDAER